MGETLDREEFCDSAKNLFETLTVTDKNAILNFARDKTPLRKKFVNTEATYKPKIGKRSE